MRPCKQFWIDPGIEHRSGAIGELIGGVGSPKNTWTVISSPWLVGLYRGLYYPFISQRIHGMKWYIYRYLHWSHKNQPFMWANIPISPIDPTGWGWNGSRFDSNSEFPTGLHASKMQQKRIMHRCIIWIHSTFRMGIMMQQFLCEEAPK